MDAILNRLNKLGDNELLQLSEAIDLEIDRRQDYSEDSFDSARHRAVQRQKSYKRSVGSSAIPVRMTGLKEQVRRRAA